MFMQGTARGMSWAEVRLRGRLNQAAWYGRMFWSTIPGGGDDDARAARSRPKSEGCLSVDGA